MVKLTVVVKIPNKLQGVLWSRDVSSLDIQKDKNYIIHQVLMYGSLEDIEWLKTIYSDIEIKEAFSNHPRKVYTKPAYNFIKNYLLGISKPLSEQKYVKTTPRDIR